MREWTDCAGEDQPDGEWREVVVVVVTVVFEGFGRPPLQESPDDVDGEC